MNINAFEREFDKGLETANKFYFENAKQSLISAIALHLALRDAANSCLSELRKTDEILVDIVEEHFKAVCTKTEIIAKVERGVE
jgi:hypothetical protein